MTKTFTIENINGADYTVVWCKYAYADSYYIAEDDFYVTDNLGVKTIICRIDDSYVATALPALPRKPKAEDAPLLYRYMSDGVVLWFDTDFSSNTIIIPNICSGGMSQITHATDKQGNKLEVAINDQ